MPSSTLLVQQQQVYSGSSMADQSVSKSSSLYEDPGLPLAALSASSHHSHTSASKDDDDQTTSRVVRFDTGGAWSPNKNSKAKIGGKVAQLRAAFDNSFNASMNESMNSMDASWAQFSVNDDEEQDGKDEKEMGDEPGKENVKEVEVKLDNDTVAKLEKGSNKDNATEITNGTTTKEDDDDVSTASSDDDDSLASLGGGGMDTSTNLSERVMQQSRTFHESFLRLGDEEEEEDDTWVAGLNKKRYSRGSVFLWADAKLANSKIVQSRLEKAAIKLQNFFRRCLVVLRRVGEERQYLQNEKVDIQRRLQEELVDVQKYIQEEKEQFQCELEQEINATTMTTEEWESFQRYTATTKPEIVALKVENERLIMQCKKIRRHNEQLKVRDPDKEMERKRLQDKVDSLEIENEQWEVVRDRFIAAIKDAKEKRDILREKRQNQRSARKKLELVVGEIVEFVEDEQEDENPRLCEKLNKLKRHREKSVRKMKRRMNS